MTLEAGTSIGPYQILGSLGAGGMGEVYRARDTRLDRMVAIKILPDSFAADAERVARFEREARTLAAVNHPNVAHIYGLEDLHGRRALAMEYVAGENLAERLRRGAIPVEEALAIARQIADGLDAAHGLGIIHRDLKPSNIQLREDGTAKILDFGLAKALSATSTTPDLISSPTITSPAMTEFGVVLGTAAYMAPEQAKGRPVDKRADIWAFGVVLYEMVTGRRAFEGADVSEMLAGVLRLEPDWTPVPQSLRRVLKSCLEKDPRLRLRDIGDWSRLIDEAPVGVGQLRLRRPWAAWATAAAGLAAAASLAVVHYRERAADLVPLRFQIPAPPGNVLEPWLSLSPDGRRLVFTARDTGGVTRLWIHDLDALDARVVSGTEGCRSAFWSPDGRSLGVVMGRQLKRIDLDGGRELILHEVQNPGELGAGTWSVAGIVFGSQTQGPVRLISPAGGPVTPITAVDPARSELNHGLAEFLPDGRHFLYFRVARDPAVNGVYVGSIDSSPAEQPLTRLIDSNQGALYVASDQEIGRLLFLQNGTLMAQSFDAGRQRLTGDAVPVVDTVTNTGARGLFSAAANVLAYRTGPVAAGGRVAQLTWLDRSGKTLTTVGEPGTWTTFELSSDSTRAVVTDAGITDRNLWILDLSRGLSTRLVVNTASETFPVWSPDMRKVAFASNRNGPQDIFVKTVGGATEELLFKSERNKLPTSWSRDGRFLLFVERSQQGPGDVVMVPVEGDRTPIPLLHSDFDEREGRFSPDLRWITFTSNESGRDEVYLRAFDAASPASAGSITRLSKDGGSSARWRQDGKEVVFAGPTGRLMSVEIGDQPGLPVPLFMLPAVRPQFSLWDISGDGKRFLVPMPDETSSLTPINVLVNWSAR